EQNETLRTFYPTSVMETGHDIIFFWVARMMMFGLHFMNEVPFRTVFLHAMVRDEKGDKMSKVKGNVIDPLDVIRGQADAARLTPELKKKYAGKGMPPYGADALRFTLTALTAQGRDIKLSLDRLEGYRNFVNKLWNASRFVLMNLGEPAAVVQRLEKPLKQMPLSLADRWLLARLNHAVRETLEQLEAFRFNDASNTLYQFAWGEFCDWYIELSKGSLYGSDEEAKGTTRAVLAYALDQLLKLLHPFMPYVTEEIWQRLPRRPGDPESVMVAPYPWPQESLVDEEAEREMATVIAAINGIRNIRGESNIPPSRKIRAIVQAAPEIRDALERNRAYLEPLAGLESVEIAAPGPKPRVSATFVEARMEICVPLEGVVDLAEERRRIEKELAKVDADLQMLKKKLENPNFAQRAPPEIVEKDRSRIGELEQKRLKLTQGLLRLSADVGETQVPEPGKVTIHEPPKPPPSEQAEESVDLTREMAQELADVKVPQGPDPVVADQLKKLQEGTKEGLSESDHYDLGVAYMGMGLVNEAVREFAQAGVSAPVEGKVPPRPLPPKAKALAKKAPEKKKKAAAPRKPASKRTAAAKKPSPKKGTAKPKAKAKKAASKKAALAKKPARKARR
ncbi:MAG: class I tRNA ligase family protein, partial [Deltaproteobacteria bacterium]|nr:class I tRNA ligase family protein [Deltaproteobacteria bacterium]